MKIKYLITPLLLLCLLSSCSRRQIDLEPNYWSHKKSKVVVVEKNQTKPLLHLKGAQGGLEFAVNMSQLKDLSNYIRKQDTTWVKQVGYLFEKKLNQKGMQAAQYDSIPIVQAKSVNKKSHSPITFKDLHSDQLLEINLVDMGGVRYYYSLFPLGDPKAFCKLEGRLIDLTTNKPIWQKTVEVSESIERPWDQKPNFPNFSKALRLAEQKASKLLLDSLFKNA